MIFLSGFLALLVALLAVLLMLDVIPMTAQVVGGMFLGVILGGGVVAYRVVPS